MCKTLIPLAKRRISLAKTKMADPIEIEEEGTYVFEEEGTYVLSLFKNFSHDSEFEGSNFDESSTVANVHAVFAYDLC